MPADRRPADREAVGELPRGAVRPRREQAPRARRRVGSASARQTPSHVAVMRNTCVTRWPGPPDGGRRRGAARATDRCRRATGARSAAARWPRDQDTADPLVRPVDADHRRPDGRAWPAASWRARSRSAGGLGMIGVSGATTADFLTEQCAIPAAAEVPFGVGLMIWVLESRPDLLEATIAAAPSLVSVSFGDPAPYVGPLHDAGIAVAAQVNTTADVAPRARRRRRRHRRAGHRGRRAHRAAGDAAAAAGGAHADRPAGGGRRRDRDRRAGWRPRSSPGAAGVWIGTPLLSCTGGAELGRREGADPRGLAATRRC